MVHYCWRHEPSHCLGSIRPNFESICHFHRCHKDLDLGHTRMAQLVSTQFKFESPGLAHDLEPRSLPVLLTAAAIFWPKNIDSRIDHLVMPQ